MLTLSENGLYIEDESVVIRPKNGFGGIGGEYIKPTALANVHAFYQRSNPQIQIIGTGGVLTGRDAFEHILCGASMVQVGTTLHKEGVCAFDRITNELKAIMTEKRGTKTWKISVGNCAILTKQNRKTRRKERRC